MMSGYLGTSRIGNDMLFPFKGTVDSKIIRMSEISCVEKFMHNAIL